MLEDGICLCFQFLSQLQFSLYTEWTHNWVGVPTSTLPPPQGCRYMLWESGAIHSCANFCILMLSSETAPEWPQNGLQGAPTLLSEHANSPGTSVCELHQALTRRNAADFPSRAIWGPTQETWSRLGDEVQFKKEGFSLCLMCLLYHIQMFCKLPWGKQGMVAI